MEGLFFFKLFCLFFHKNKHLIAESLELIWSNFSTEFQVLLGVYAQNGMDLFLSSFNHYLPVTYQFAGIVVTHIVYHYQIYYKLIDLALKVMHYYGLITQTSFCILGIGAAIALGRWPVSTDLLTCPTLTVSSDWLYKSTEQLGELPTFPKKFIFLKDKEEELRAMSVDYYLPDVKEKFTSVFTEEEYNQLRAFKLSCKDEDLDDFDTSSIDLPLLTEPDKIENEKSSNTLIFSLGVSVIIFIVGLALGGKGV